MNALTRRFLESNTKH